MNPIPPVIPEFRRPPEASPVPRDRESGTSGTSPAARFEELLSKNKTVRREADQMPAVTARQSRKEERVSKDLTVSRPEPFEHDGVVALESNGLVIARSDVTREEGATSTVADAEGPVDGDEPLLTYALRAAHRSGNEEEHQSDGNPSGQPAFRGPVLDLAVQAPENTPRISGTEAVIRISELSRLIAESASTVTLDESGTATIELAQSQLPDSKVVIKIDQNSVKVTFLTDNPSSIAVLQARGAEVAGALSLRFDREISVELVDESEAGAESASSLGSWAVARGAFGGQAGEGGGAGSGTPS